MYDTPLIPGQTHEYSVVREERETIKNEHCTQEIVKGYDSKGRLVEHGVFTTEKDGTTHHVFKSVGANGYWVGGFGMNDKDGNYVNGGTLGPEPFEENESHSS